MDKPRVEGWSWQRIGDLPAVKGAAVMVIAIFALWTYSTWDERPAKPTALLRDLPLELITSLQGVHLGQKFADVASTHGPFEKEPPSPQTVKKYADEEDYRQKRGQLRLAVRAGAIQSISYPCKEGPDPTAVNKVACQASGDRIRTVFGDNVRVLCAKVRPDNKDLAPFARAYDAVEYGTRYVVVKDKVQGFIVTEPKELESLVGFNWVKCTA